MLNVVENILGEMSSNLGQGRLHFTLRYYP